MTNRDYFINYLRFWFDMTPMKSLGFVTFQDAIAHYDDGSNFIETFGNTVKSIPQDKVKSAFYNLAVKYGTNFPPKAEFFALLAVETSGFTWSDAADVGTETLQDVSTTLKVGLGLWVFGLGVAAVIFLLPLLRKGKK